MSCCGTNLPNIYRNADYNLTLTFPRNYEFVGASVLMTVRTEPGAADPPLLSFSLTPTGNGSVFTVVGNAIKLLIKKEDLASLPAFDPDTFSWVGSYDIVLTSVGGIEQYLFGGPFVVKEGGS